MLLTNVKAPGPLVLALVCTLYVQCIYFAATVEPAMSSHPYDTEKVAF